MSHALADWFAQLRAPLEAPDFEPDIDDKDLAKDAELREADALESGLIRMQRVQENRKGDVPQDGDLVYLQYSVRNGGGELLESTWAEEGGGGRPVPFIIGGKSSRRMPRGWELALLSSRVGDVIQLVVHPRFGYAHKDCGLAAPRGAPKGQDLHFQLALLQCYRKDSVEAVQGHTDMFKRSISRGEIWESPRAPFEVVVSVRARLPDVTGSQTSAAPYFEASPDQPLRFTMGEGRVPEAVEAGLGAMTRGERAVVSCARAAAAAGGGAEPLLPSPPGTSDRVEFELQLLSMVQVRDMTGDGAVVKRRLKDGRGEFPVDCPIEDSAVRVHYRCIDRASGATVLDTRGEGGAAPPVEFQTGMGEAPEGLDMAVRLMTPGEVSSVRAAAAYAYDGRADRPEGLQEGAAVEWEVELVDFDKQAHATQMSAPQLLARGALLKDQGNTAFRKGLTSHATTKWMKALKQLNQIFETGPDAPREAVDSIKASCMVNLALASQREGNMTQALDWAEKALREVPDQPKALWRRAAVNAFVGQLDKAEADFRRVAEVDPTAAADARREIARMRQKEASANRRQRGQFGGLFDRRDG